MKKHTKLLKTIKVDVYNIYIVLAIGVNYNDLLGFTKRNFSEDAIKDIEKNQSLLSNLMEDTGFAYRVNGVDFAILYLKSFEDNWKFYEILMHETFHLTDFITDSLCMGLKETEARAYLHQFIFKSARIAIQNKFLK